MSRYKSDPRWISARFSSMCEDCNKTINKGDMIFYYPIGKHVSCESCGDSHSRDFESCKGDEEGIPFAS